MDAQFNCETEKRRKAVLKPKDDLSNDVPPKINGIDYLDVSADQKTLTVYFLHPLPPEAGQVPPAGLTLTDANLLLEGGVQITNIEIVPPVTINGNVLEIKVKEPGDFSIYRLCLVQSPTELNPPAGYDPPLSVIDFSFKIDCPSEFDCKPPQVCPPDRLVEPAIDYLAKDYASFRRLMLDRLSILMPTWTERNPADVQIALVELMAYVGDYLSYAQDAAATEVYLGTAQQRISVRRHARLLDYTMHEGCNARTWVHLKAEDGGDADGMLLAKGTAFSTKGEASGKTQAKGILAAHGFDPVVFETMHDLLMHSAHNEISFYTWSDEACCLPKGATRATLVRPIVDAKGVIVDSKPIEHLAPGDVLLFEEICSPTTGLKADADPTHRHVVRLKTVTLATDPLKVFDGAPLKKFEVVEIAWHEADALPFPLCLSERLEGKLKRDISVARGNIVLADQGETTEKAERLTMPQQGLARLRLKEPDVSFAQPYEHTTALLFPAAGVLEQDPRKAVPAVSLKDDDETWTARFDLLGSDRFAADFVVEVDQQRRAHLRFGDDILGKEPSAGTTFDATYRLGNGPAGNVGAETLVRLKDGGFEDVTVRNPLPAQGGTTPEAMEQVRQYAPQAFRTQQRAVTASDWAEVAERHDDVQQAAACFRWTGSWYTVFVTIDRKGGRTIEDDPAFETEIRQHLEQFRLAGYDLEINDPIFVPLDIKLVVCVKPGYFRSNVKASLLQVFSRFDLPGQGRGFFHPDNFTFGQPVYLSKIYEAAMAVTGVASVEVERFQRWFRDPANEIRDGILKTAALEVIRLDNDLSAPENGKIEFEMRGGL